MKFWGKRQESASIDDEIASLVQTQLTGHCLLWHKWTRWSDPERDTEGASIMRVFGVPSTEMQSRFCLRCNKAQRRFVGWE
jgi:hypothetical protein